MLLLLRLNHTTLFPNNPSQKSRQFQHCAIASFIHHGLEKSERRSWLWRMFWSLWSLVDLSWVDSRFFSFWVSRSVGYSLQTQWQYQSYYYKLIHHPKIIYIHNNNINIQQQYDQHWRQQGDPCSLWSRIYFYLTAGWFALNRLFTLWLDESPKCRGNTSAAYDFAFEANL